MEDQLKQLSQAVLQGIQGGDRSAGSDNGAVNSFASGLFGDVLAKQGNVGVMAGATADRQEQEAAAARAAEARRLQDKMDPSKYRMQRKDDGGFDFFDPDGNSIDVKQYAQVTGRTPAEVLAKSENPFDIQFLNDYGSTRNLVDAIQTGDTDTITSYVKDDNGIDPKSTAADIMGELARKYPHIYGKGRYEDSFGQSNNKPLFKLSSGMGSGSGGGGNSISSLLK
jgi:hypothetical protein